MTDINLQEPDGFAVADITDDLNFIALDRLPSREDRLKALRSLASRVFVRPENGPEAEAYDEMLLRFERGFQVPQQGPYHREGAFMDSHLYIIRANIQNIAEGRFPEDVPEYVRQALHRTISSDPLAVEQYVFLHDITKAECLTLTLDSGEKQAVTWDEWQGMLRSSKSGQSAIKGSEAALNEFCREHGIVGISYYQQEDEGEKISHGDTGAEYIERTGLIDNSTMLAAIRAHEVAFSFENINVPTYDRYFGNFTQEERDFALTASYVDTMAAYQSEDGSNPKPDLTNFLALASSREKAESCREILAIALKGGQVLDEMLDVRIAEIVQDEELQSAIASLVEEAHPGRFRAGEFAQAYMKLRSSKDAIGKADVAERASKIVEHYEVERYDMSKLEPELRKVLAPHVSTGLITDGQIDTLIEALKTPDLDARKKATKGISAIRQEMKSVRELLATHKI
mgnify:CR=1 FL=1